MIMKVTRIFRIKKSPPKSTLAEIRGFGCVRKEKDVRDSRTLNLPELCPFLPSSNHQGQTSSRQVTHKFPGEHYLRLYALEQSFLT